MQVPQSTPTQESPSQSLPHSLEPNSARLSQEENASLDQEEFHSSSSSTLSTPELSPVSSRQESRCSSVNPGSDESASPSPSPDNESESDDEVESPTRKCNCPNDFVDTLLQLKRTRASEEGLAFFITTVKSQMTTQLCHTHLRTFCSRSVGLQSNYTHDILLDRIAEVYKAYPRIDKLHSSTPGWFYKDVQGSTEEEKKLGVYMFPDIPRDGIVIDDASAHMIMNRFGGPTCAKTWEADGTVIIPDVFAYLDTPDLKNAMDIEFDIYRHHHRQLHGKRRLGWLRNMFFSLIQQLTRQDLVWYALAVACRPDHNFRLITHPYITKDTNVNERTGFLHLDLNVARFVKDGHGANLLSSTLSLDDEDDEGCTVVVKGFHRHIGKWQTARIRRGDKSSSYTTNFTPTRYTAKDRALWGQPTPQPCPAFGIRITRVEIPHGSTSHSSKRRRLLSAWHMGVDEMHRQLDIDKTLSWEELSACHRDLEAPAREPSGQTPQYGFPTYRFPASEVLGSISPIGDALIGPRKYTDP
jgi:hypothetical protein